MTVNEFKAWFEGFTSGREALGKAELAVLKKKVEELDADHFLVQWWPAYPSVPETPRRWTEIWCTT